MLRGVKNAIAPSLLLWACLVWFFSHALARDLAEVSAALAFLFFVAEKVRR